MKDLLDGNGRRAFVTGATGFIGANLVRELLDRGWEVTACRRSSSNLFRIACLRLELAEADVLDTTSLERAIPEAADAIFHLAADLRLSDRASDEQVAINVLGTRNVLAVAKSLGVRKVVMVSSMAAFGLHRERIDETVRSNAERVPIGYFQSKWRGEIEADRAVEAGLDVTVVNPANVMGPFDLDNMAATLVRRVAGSRMPVTGGGSASFCHARAISAAMVNAVDRGRTGERYLLGGADASFLELGAIVADITGGRAPSECLPRYGSLYEAEAVELVAKRLNYEFLTPEIALAVSSDMLVDDAKARRELDYAPASLRQLVCDELNWLRDRRLVPPRSAVR